MVAGRVLQATVFKHWDSFQGFLIQHEVAVSLVGNKTLGSFVLETFVRRVVQKRNKRFGAKKPKDVLKRIADCKVD